MSLKRNELEEIASDLFAVEVAATGGDKRNSCRNIKLFWDTSFSNEGAHGTSINESSKCYLGVFGWIEDNFDMWPKACCGLRVAWLGQPMVGHGLPGLDHRLQSC